MNAMPNEFDAFLRRYLAAFNRAVFRATNPGATYLHNWHIDAMVHYLELCRQGRIKRLLITVPPRTGKTGLVSVAFPAFVLGHDPTKRIIFSTYAEKYARDVQHNFRRLMAEPFYKRLFPATVVVNDTQDQLFTTRNGNRRSTSVGGVLTGLGADILIVDDIMKAGDTPSAATREAAQLFYSQTLVTRFEDPAKGVIIVVMQRLHEDDLAGYLLAQGGWTHLNLPAICPEDMAIPIGEGKEHLWRQGDLLWPERLGQEILDDYRSVMGMAFPSQYLQAPMPADGNMIRREWLKRYDRLPPREESRVVQSWDTAVKGNSASNYSVCTTWYEHKGLHYLADLFRKQVDYPDLKKATIDLYNQYRPDALLIEDKGNGSALIQDLRREGVFPKAINPVGDKEGRLAICQPKFEAGAVLLPRDAPWLLPLESELLGFPKTKYDDQVDSVSQYFNWVREIEGGEFRYFFI